LESWVLCTQLKITSSYMNKSYNEALGTMVVFNKLEPTRRKEIALTLKGYVDDLLSKVGDLKVTTVKKTKGVVVVQEKKKQEKAKAKMKEMDDQVDKVLSK